MQSSYKIYFIRLAFVVLLASVIIKIWETYATYRFQTNMSWAILLFFVVMTSRIHFSLKRVSEKEPKKFITRFLLITGLRLFGYLIIILIYALIKREAALGFTLMFLMLYFLFSVFEVISLLKSFKNKN